MSSLGDLLPPTRILFSSAATRAAATDELLQVLGSAPEVADARALRIAIRDRESLHSTAVGLGLAVPHVRLNSVKTIVMAIAILRHPIVCETPDGLPVTAVFMLAGPADSRRDYLQWLAHVCSAWREDGWRTRLLKAPEPATAWKVLAEIPAPSLAHL